MWNKIERTFALAIFFRFLDCRTHLLLSIVPANAQKIPLEIRRNFMRAAWRLRERKFPLWHTSNCHEHKVHCFRFILSIYHFWIKPKAIEIQLFEVWVHNRKNGLFLNFAKRKIYTSLRKYDSSVRKEIKRYPDIKNSPPKGWRIF